MRHRRARATAPVVALGLAATLALGACGSSGRDLRDPEPGAVSPTRSTPSTVAPVPSSLNLGTLVPGSLPGTTVGGTAPGTGGTTPGSSLRLTTTAFGPGGTIPTELSCTGPSPDLRWEGVPAGTVELALVMNDPTAEPSGFVHWVVVGIPPTNGSVAKGQTPSGAEVLPNGAGNPIWFGPCPPPGKVHTYEFTLYALPAAYTAPSGANAKAVIEDIEAKASASATLSGTYER